MKFLGLQNVMTYADANPRLYDRLITVCAVVMAAALLGAITLAVQPIGGNRSARSATMIQVDMGDAAPVTAGTPADSVS